MALTEKKAAKVSPEEQQPKEQQPKEQQPKGQKSKGQQPDQSSAAEVEPPLASVHRMEPTKAQLPNFTPSDSDWLSHPFTSSEYPLQTPNVQRMYSAVRRAIRNNISGRYFKAFHGDGVTETLRALSEMLEESIAGLDVVYHSLAKDRAPGVRILYLSYWLTLAGSHVVGRTEDLKARLMLRFEELARKSKPRAAVLLLDNLQHIEAEDVMFLSDLRHYLHDQGLKLIVFSGGHDPDMAAISRRIKKSELSSEAWKEIVGAEIPFTGVRSMRDIREIFASIDEQIHAGASWPAFFVRYPDGRALVLERESENFEVALHAVAKGTQKNLLAIGITLRALMHTIRIFFDFSSQLKSDVLTDEERQHCWKEALVWTHLADTVNGKGDAGVLNGGLSDE